MPTHKLTADQRREMVLAALRHDYRTMQDLADRYGVARSRLYVLLGDAKADPENALVEAYREVAFREEVNALLNGE